MIRIGIDLGGSKIEGVALAPDGTPRTTARRHTPQHDYPATIAAVADLVAALKAEASAPSASVGIGAPGSANRRDGHWQGANCTWINGHPLQADIEAALGHPVRIENDANCFAVSEAMDGAAAGAHLVFGVIIGTGVGGGIAVDGRAWDGRNGIAGEWGHTPLPWMHTEEYPGRDCFCGRRGCMETWVSGPAFERAYHARTGASLRATDIAAAAATDPHAAGCLAAYVDRLARGLAVIVNILDPDVIVLGGGVSRIDQLTELLPATIARYIFSDSFGTPVRAARHGDASGVRGAAHLWSR